MRARLPMLILGLSAPLAAACSPTYPADRQTWSLVDTPNVVPESTIGGSLDLFEASDVSEGARLTESVERADTLQKLTILWDGSWEGDREGVDLHFTCTSLHAENVESFECKGATLELHCEVTEAKLDCGDYVFQ